MSPLTTTLFLKCVLIPGQASGGVRYDSEHHGVSTTGFHQTISGIIDHVEILWPSCGDSNHADS